jgi:hypothetical protein
MMAGWFAYNQRLIDGGHWISGANLQPTPTATTVQKPWGGTASIIDGPFMETKEQLGGFYLISAADLDEALALAADIPIPAGSIEVRPVAFRARTLTGNPVEQRHLARRLAVATV